ncbi:MAG TPA: M15 family metallopeptidase [Bauldia sp.]|nr:M15 family metallopeptidase [Bauldia sp.]
MVGFDVTPQAGMVRAISRLNIRSGAPSRSAPVLRKVEPGTELAVAGVAKGETFHGNDLWYAGDGGSFFWSGACSDFHSGEPAPAAAGAAMTVRRRPNGTILPLSEAEIETVFGRFTYTEGHGGRIVIPAAWTNANLGEADTPALGAVGQSTLLVHKKAIGSFERVFKAIAAAGLVNRILTYDGLFVPRHKGWNPARGLSSHSWGIAIDLNARWNGYGVPAAAAGAYGSVRELVPYFAAEGFAWGGYFSPPYEDGMHFELARLDL